MRLDDEVYDECIEKIRKTMNFYGHQNREMADDILSDVSVPISRPLQETIRQQQAEIERLTEQRDRLRVAFVQNMIRAFPDKTHSEISTLIA